MEHDPRCFSVHGPDPLDSLTRVCICDRLSATRREALVEAAHCVNQYAEERLIRTKYPNASEDISAALRVAAKRVRALYG